MIISNAFFINEYLSDENYLNILEQYEFNRKKLNRLNSNVFKREMLRKYHKRDKK